MDGDDEWDHSERASAHRARAKSLLDQIPSKVKQALTEQGLDISVFFLISNSGEAILSFSTIGDPPTTSGTVSVRSSHQSCSEDRAAWGAVPRGDVRDHWFNAQHSGNGNPMNYREITSNPFRLAASHPGFGGDKRVRSPGWAISRRPTLTSV